MFLEEAILFLTVVIIFFLSGYVYALINSLFVEMESVRGCSNNRNQYYSIYSLTLDAGVGMTIKENTESTKYKVNLQQYCHNKIILTHKIVIVRIKTDVPGAKFR